MIEIQNAKKMETENTGHGVKVGPGPDLGPRIWVPPQSLKVGPGTPFQILK